MLMQIAYSNYLPDVLHQTPAEFEQQARMAMAVKLYEMKKLSSGMAAELVGMDRISFLLRLPDYGVPVIDLDEDELRADIDHA
jgi:predicted HTH domain antitoxin